MILAVVPVTALAWHNLLVFLLQVSVLLLFALCLGRLAVRLRMPALVGELMTGLLLGPSVFGRLAPDLAGWLMPSTPDQSHLIDAVGQLGVVLLVGITGMQLDVSMIRRKGATAARVSLLSLVIPLGLSVATAYLLPASMYPGSVDRRVFALFLGVAMAVTAIPVIAKIFADMNLLYRDLFRREILLSPEVKDELASVGLCLQQSLNRLANTVNGSLRLLIMAARDHGTACGCRTGHPRR